MTDIPSPPYVITVILNTNRRDDTLACLASLQASTYPRHTVLVLDNHSTDGSAQAIQDAFPQVKVIPLENNLGYAGNNNVGIKIAMIQEADWVFVLNEDTIVDEDCISCLVEAGCSGDNTGIVGPMVYHFDEPAVIQSAGGKLGWDWWAWHLSQNESDDHYAMQPRKVDWISGCGIMVKKEVIDQVGALDERFFYYWEEVEWCVRTKAVGWEIMHVPQAKLWHKGVQRDYQPSPNVTYYFTRNWFLMLSKHRAC
jgi:GT2 family glycosyltransferase